MGLAKLLLSVKDLPYDCQKHADVVRTLERRNTKSNPEHEKALAYQGMGAAAKGRSNQAQIQRRLTSTRRFTKKK